MTTCSLVAIRPDVISLLLRRPSRAPRTSPRQWPPGDQNGHGQLISGADRRPSPRRAHDLHGRAGSTPREFLALHERTQRQPRSSERWCRVLISCRFVTPSLGHFFYGPVDDPAGCVPQAPVGGRWLGCESVRRHCFPVKCVLYLLPGHFDLLNRGSTGFLRRRQQNPENLSGVRFQRIAVRA